jgi:DNA-binding FrmR family transcriptional regulator
MIDEDRYCIDILQQISAVKAAIDKVAIGVLEDHVRHCMSTGAADEQQREEMTAELTGAVSRLVRS